LEWLVDAAGLTIIIGLLIGNSTLVGEVKQTVILLVVAGYIFSLLTCGLILSTFLLWRKRLGTLTSRVLYSVVTLMAIIFVWFLKFWNIIFS
jgi:hypothetical protein